MKRKHLPVEEFAAVKCFTVQGNDIELKHLGKRVRLSFDSEGDLLLYLRAWAAYHSKKPAVAMAPGTHHQLLAPRHRFSAFA